MTTDRGYPEVALRRAQHLEGKIDAVVAWWARSVQAAKTIPLATGVDDDGNIITATGIDEDDDFHVGEHVYFVKQVTALREELVALVDSWPKLRPILDRAEGYIRDGQPR